MSNVREYREKLGMKQSDLLAVLKETEPRLDIGTLSRIETGLALPGSEELLTALASALQASRSDLFDGLEVFCIEDTKSEIRPVTALVAAAVPEGKKNAITRKELAERLGVCDRTMRSWVEDARADGLPICNDQDGKGYYQPETLEEVERQYKQSRNRTMVQLRQQKYLRARMQG